MKLSRVERHIIIKSEILEELTHKSKNLYNYANYLIRKYFFETGKLLKEFELTTQLAKDNQIDYRDMPSAQSAQQTIKLLFKNWKSFFKAIRDYKKNPSKYKGRPKLPKYKDKKGHNIVVFTNQNCKIKTDEKGENYVYFPKKSNLNPIKTKIEGNLKQVRIIPEATCFIVEIVYEKEFNKVIEANDNILSIDLGLNNLLTTFNNIGEKPFIVRGKIVKSINQYYNKRKAKLMSFIGDKGTSNRIKKLTLKRNNKINDYLHKTSRTIIDYCLLNNISKIIIGNNKNWKQNINIGKKNNQNFVSIPFEKLISQIEYKAEEVGIEVLRTEESYTSKIDHLVKEELKKQENYLGKRVKRGLFKSSSGIVINADVNGAMGIFRKVVPDLFDQWLDTVGNRGFASNPVVIKLDYKGNFNNV
jgi:putative transposase